MVARARNYLSQFSGVERVYHFMLAEAAKANPLHQLQQEIPRLRGDRD